jgi:FMN phosphatase YigB (HAD superfamily)
MMIRAAILDVYNTLLKVGLPPADAEDRWESLCREFLNAPPALTRADFASAASVVISRLHSDARSKGIPWPEVQWPSIVREVLPALGELAPDRVEEFVFRQMQLSRTLKLVDGSAECLRYFREQGCRLGIISNAQGYTLRELSESLAPVNIDLFWFENDLQFWSFENGFSKPDPHAFRILTARLERSGVAPGQILMIGDRLDNDIEPARAQGWKTWHLLGEKGTGAAGRWKDLREWIEQGTPNP